MKRLALLSVLTIAIAFAAPAAWAHGPGTCGNGLVDAAGEECDIHHGTGDGCCTVDCKIKDVAGCCTSSADCNDGSACSGTETCDLASWQCQAGAAIDCNDGDTCTNDACQEPSGECTNTVVPLDLANPATLVCTVEALVNGLL